LIFGARGLAGWARRLRGVLLAMIAVAPSAQAQTSGPGAVTYPVKFASGLTVARGSSPNREFCIIQGFRAVPPDGSRSGPLFLTVEAVFDESGNRFVRGQASIDLDKSAFTNFDRQPIDVKIDLDGKSYDIPSADIHVAVVTFLSLRFPVEMLNTIASAETLKVYTIDPKSRTPILFATADLVSDQAAFAQHGKCANSLPAYPSEAPGGSKISQFPRGCVAIHGDGSATAGAFGGILVRSRGRRRRISRDCSSWNRRRISRSSSASRSSGSAVPALLPDMSATIAAPAIPIASSCRQRPSTGSDPEPSSRSRMGAGR
jgi:hypothetical protein